MPKLNYREIKKQITDKKFSKSYFLYGDEKYLINKVEKALLNRIIEGDKNQFNMIEINGSKIDLESLLVYTDTYPVFSKNKCVLIKDMDIDQINSDDVLTLVNIVKNISDFCIIIISQTSIVIDTKKSAKWRNFINSIIEYACIVEITSKNSISIENQIVSWVKGYGKSITFDLAKLIIEKCGRDLNNLKNEIDKLCAFEELDVISKGSIDSIVIENLESNIFSICNLLLNGNYEEMNKRIDIVFNNNEDPVAMLAAISSNYIDMYRLSLSIKYGNSVADIKNYFDYSGNKEFKIKVAEKNIKKLSLDSIKESIEELIKADKDLKSLYIDPKIIIETLIGKLIEIKDRR